MNISQQTVEALAARLRRAAETGVAIAPIRDELAAGGVSAAYAVQRTNTEHYVARGRRVSGRKIGLTSESVQRQLGVDSPDFGMLFADMAVGNGDEIALGRVMQPKVEAEVALVLERDVSGPDVSVAQIISATAYALPAIEIVGSRIANWNIGLLDTIADNASSGLYVLGDRPVNLAELDLVQCAMLMERRGETVSTGTGAACLGSPLNAAAWLARTMIEVGSPLRAGDVVMTGALGPMVAVAPGDVIDVRISDLGRVRAAFSASS